MAVNNEVLAINLAKKLAKRINMEVTIVRSRRKTRKYYLAAPAYGIEAPKNHEYCETVTP
jgi:hypothetical protein